MTSVCGLLLPGMTLNETIFPKFSFPTICVEFNRAPPPSATRSDRMADYIVELQSRLNASDQWQRAERRIVIAHSFGGMLAQRWLLEEAGWTVDRLLLVGTTAGPMYDVVKLRVATVGGRELRFGIEGLMRIWNQSFMTRAVKRVMTGGSLAVRDIDFRTIPNPTDLAIDFAGWQNTDWRAMQAYRTAMQDFDTRTRLSALSVRTIVLHGDQDALFPPQVGAALAMCLPNAELRTIRGARHVLPLTHGEHVLQAVEDLIDF